MTKRPLLVRHLIDRLSNFNENAEVVFVDEDKDGVEYVLSIIESGGRRVTLYIYSTEED